MHVWSSQAIFLKKEWKAFPLTHTLGNKHSSNRLHEKAFIHYAGDDILNFHEV